MCGRSYQDFIPGLYEVFISNATHGYIVDCFFVVRSQNFMKFGQHVHNDLLHKLHQKKNDQNNHLGTGHGKQTALRHFLLLLHLFQCIESDLIGHIQMADII